MYIHTGLPARSRRRFCWSSRRPACSSTRSATYTQFSYQEFAVQDLFQGLGCPEVICLIMTKISKGWVRKEPNVGMRIGCSIL